MGASTLRQRIQQIAGLYTDGEFYARLFKIALPIAAQNFLSSSLNLVSVVMIGQLGDAPVAALALANQIFFLLTLVLFGISSGAAIFTAQLWGKRDVPNIRKVLSISTALSLLGGLAFFALSELAPEFAMGVYSRDPVVIALGSEYLRVFGWGFLFAAVTFSYSAVLRSTGDVHKPLAASLTALSFNTLLSYALIFGTLGLPKMGMQGAAAAGFISRVLECGLLLWLTYRTPSPAAASLKELAAVDFHFAKKILKPVLPVMMNELLWALGVSAYDVVYARIGTEAIAAMNIVSTVDGMAGVIFFAIGSACAVLVGNQIGAEQEPEAYRSALRSLSLAALAGVLVSLLILVTAAPVLSWYRVSPVVIDNAHKVLIILAAFSLIRGVNFVFFVGVLRSGGDIRFAFLIDVGMIWGVGVTMASLGAFVLHLPVYWVYLMVMGDEIGKFVLSIWRFTSRKWIHNLARTVAPPIIETSYFIDTGAM